MVDQNFKKYTPKVERNCKGISQAVGDGGCNYQCDQFPGFKFYRSDLGGCVKDYCYEPTNKAMADPYFKSQCSVQPPAQTANIDMEWTVGNGNPGDKYEFSVSCKNSNGIESNKMIFGTGSGSNLQPYVYTVSPSGYKPPFCWKSLPKCPNKDHNRVLYQRIKGGMWNKVKEVPSNISLSTGGATPNTGGICTWLYPNAPLPPADGWVKYPGWDMAGNDIGCAWWPMADYNNLDKLKKDCLSKNCVGFIKVKRHGDNNNFFYCPKNKAGKNYLTKYNSAVWDSGDAYVHYAPGGNFETISFSTQKEQSVTNQLQNIILGTINSNAKLFKVNIKLTAKEQGWGNFCSQVRFYILRNNVHASDDFIINIATNPRTSNYKDYNASNKYNALQLKKGDQVILELVTLGSGCMVGIKSANVDLIVKND